MLVTSADRWQLAPGEVLSWRVRAGSTVTPAELSVNQRNHLRGLPTIWLAATFDVAGPVDVPALTAAYQALIRRHSTLQCELVWDGDEPRAVRHEPRELFCHPRPASTSDVAALLARECSPLSYPAFALAAVSRPDLSTVVIGFDHLHVDAHSIAIVAGELHALYQDASRELPPAGCFVSRAAEWSGAPRLSAHDPRLDPWLRTFEALDYELPRCPAPLGLADGEVAEQRTELRALAGPDAAAALGHVARGAGTSTYGALLTSMAHALREAGASGPAPLLAPVQIRRAEDRATVGWFTTTVPIIADTDLAVTAANVEQARRAAGVPLDQVLASLPRPLRWTRRDAFMVSYVDYRRLPGTLDLLAPHHVSATAPTDDVQIWLSRTDSGVAARVRFPHTATARAFVDGLLELWSAAIDRLSAGSLTPA